MATSFVTQRYYARKARCVMNANKASGASGTIVQMATNLEIMAFLMDAVFLVAWGPIMMVALLIAVGRGHLCVVCCICAVLADATLSVL